MRQKFRIALQNRFQPLENLLGDNEETFLNTEKKWLRLKPYIKKAAIETVGYLTKQSKKWLTEETWKSIDRRKELKVKLLSATSEEVYKNIKTEYQNADKIVKNSAKQDKRKYKESMADEAENAAKHGDYRTVYQITNKLCGAHMAQNIPVKDKEGNFLKTEKEQLIGWAEHFIELLNRPEPNKLPNFDLTNIQNLNIITEDITRDDLEAALKTVKNNKASGCDEITGEMLKALDETSKGYLLTIFNEIWNNETPPQEWRDGIIVKLPKKGDLGDCNNWRGITLLSSVGKLFCTILLKRMKKEVDSILREE